MPISNVLKYELLLRYRRYLSRYLFIIVAEGSSTILVTCFLVIFCKWKGSSKEPKVSARRKHQGGYKSLDDETGSRRRAAARSVDMVVDSKYRGN